MTTCSTFFLATFEQVQAAFVGWKPPLAAPVRQLEPDLFTRQRLWVESIKPIWDREERRKAAAMLQGYQGHRDRGRGWNRWLRKQEAQKFEPVPACVREWDHWQCMGFTTLEFQELRSALGIDEYLVSALYSPPSRGGVLKVLPRRMVQDLAACDLQRTAAAWRSAMSQYSDPDGDGVVDTFDASMAMEWLTALVGLARRASEGQGVYAFFESGPRLV